MSPGITINTIGRMTGSHESGQSPAVPILVTTEDS